MIKKEDYSTYNENNELIWYKKKGTKPIRQIKVSLEVFTEFLECYKSKGILRVVNNLETFNNLCFGLHQRGTVFFYASPEQETQAFRLVLTGAMIAFNNDCETKYPKLFHKTCFGAYDYVLVCSSAVTTKDVKNDTASSVTGFQARNWGKKEIEKHYTKEQVEDIIKTKGLDTRPQPFRFRNQMVPNVIHKYENCLYQDIHKAHNSELIKLFPECKAFEKMYKNAMYFKSVGDKANAQVCKDYPNLLVGCLAMKYKTGEHKGNPIKWLYGLDTTPLYNRIVKDIYDKINAQYSNLGASIKSKLIYAQTDGLIISNPDWSKVKDSDALGEFGIEPIDNKEVWTYFQPTTKESTGYCIYQYFENGEKIVKGDLPDEFKDLIDLSKGQVVRYKKTNEYIDGTHYYVKNTLLNKETI